MKPNSDVYLDLTQLFFNTTRPEAPPVVQQAGLMGCPGNGVIDQLGDIQGTHIPQAQGQYYSLVELLGHSEARAQPFVDGQFASTRLASDDDHRVYMPLSGRLMEMMYIPGSSVCLCNLPSDSGEWIPRLFAHSHEQVACVFQTEAGPMAMILIGATFAGSIETVWAGKMKPLHGKGKKIMNYNFRDVAIQLNQGQEMARFNMGGSAVLILFGPGCVRWRPGLVAGTRMKVSESLGLPLQANAALTNARQCRCA